jgi:Flp pilus assembly protein TadB
MADISGAPQPVRPTEGSAESTGDLVRNLTEQVSRLFRDELKLAEYEMTRKARRLTRGAGMFGGSGLCALYGVGCLLAAAIIALALVIPAWLAALVIGAALLAVAGLAALLGKNQLGRATPPLPEQATASVKADVAEIKERAHR